MREHFFGPTFYLTFFSLLVLYILGFAAINTPAVPWLAGIFALGILILTFKKIEWGLFIAAAELFSTSHGHLFSFEVSGFEVGLRVIIFLAVLLAWGAKFIVNNELRHRFHQRLTVFGWPWFLLGLGVAVGLLVGFVNNDPVNVFKDANAYGFILYLLPVLSVEWDAVRRRQLLQVMIGAAAVVAVVTFFLLYLFTHFDEPVQRAVYTYVRDARLAELTRLPGGVFRIFLQSQFSVLFIFLMLLAGFCSLPRSFHGRGLIFGALVVSLAVLIISLSRSFWIGAIPGGLLILAISFRPALLSWRVFWQRLLVAFSAFFAALALLITVINFPLPPPADTSGFSQLLRERALAADDAAISSRWKLLPEMTRTLSSSPILGLGFGTEISFESDDPRVRAISPDGRWRTYSFEWGWLDAWLKMGLIGPLALLLIGFFSARGLINQWSKENGWLAVGFFASLVALYVIHVFSPYLNHPIGLGFLIFLIPFLEFNQPAAVKSRIPEIEYRTSDIKELGFQHPAILP